jgi:hypothetical protein
VDWVIGQREIDSVNRMLRQERIRRAAFSDVECPKMRRLVEGWAK